MTADPIAEFWQEFAATTWGKTPAVLRPGFDASLGTPDEVFAGGLDAARRYAREGEIPRVRGYLGRREQKDVSALLPRPDDATFAGFVGRLHGSYRDGGFALYVQQFQVTGEAIWRRATGFLAELQSAVGAPIGGSYLDLFVMNQHRGFTGVHKDAQDVFTCVVSGKKRMLLWPFERLLDRPGVEPNLRQRSHRLGHICDDQLRAEAIVLDAEPGDLMYWPADYWHVSEADDEPVTTLGLGVIRTADTVRFASAAAKLVLQDQLRPPSSAPLPARVGVDGALAWLDTAIAETLADPRYRERLDDAFLRWLTGFGFEEVLPLAPAADLDDDAWLRGAGPHGFCWRARHRTLAIAAHGHPLELPAHPALVRLCEQIAGGAVLRVGAVLDDATAGEPAAHRAAVRGKLRALLELLARARAVARIATPALELTSPANAA